MKKQTRRNILKTGAAALCGTVLTSSVDARGSRNPSGKKIKILVAGAHPDDPETGCGGVIAKYTSEGHDVKLLYLTRGESGIKGVSKEEAAKIRTKELIAANKILNSKPYFAGQIDGYTTVTNEWYEKIYQVLVSESPDIIFTHWPIDTHRDHRICSLLMYDAWLKTGKMAALYYFEVMTGVQSQNFHPTDYVDITPVVQTKWDACYSHKSQGIKESYPNDHGKMEIFRGMENGCKYAEGFVRHQQSPLGYLP